MIAKAINDLASAFLTITKVQWTFLLVWKPNTSFKIATKPDLLFFWYNTDLSFTRTFYEKKLMYSLCRRLLVILNAAVKSEDLFISVWSWRIPLQFYMKLLKQETTRRFNKAVKYIVRSIKRPESKTTLNLGDSLTVFLI